MKYTVTLIVLSVLWYICGRLRRETEWESWVRIKNETFHDVFFFGGFWEYRPCEIVLVVVSEIFLVIGVISMLLPLSDHSRFVMLVGAIIIMFLSLIPAFVYETVSIYRRRKKADMAGRFIKACRRNKW